MQGMCINSLTDYLVGVFLFYFLFHCFNVFPTNIKIRYIYKFYMYNHRLIFYFDNIFCYKTIGLQKKLLAYF